MGIWGAGTATAGTMQAGASIANTILSYQHAKKLQNHQYNLNRKALREYYSNTRHSLESAGYNPLLATQQGAQGFSASSGGTPSTIGDGVAEAVNSAVAYKEGKARVKNTEANTNLTNEQAETEKAKRVQMEFENAMTDVETHLKSKDLSTYDRRFYAGLYEQMQRAENYRATSAIGRMNAETNRMNAVTSRNNSAISAKRARYQNAKDYYDIKYGNPLKTAGYAWDKNTINMQGGYPDF